MKINPVILCGGSGTRLWPFSRQSLPKPFISINGEKSLLDLTLERINLVPNLGEITIVGNQRHSFFFDEALKKAGLKGKIILEP